MIFLEVREGLSVRKEDIVTVERLNLNTSRVQTKFGSYETNFAYDTLLKLLEGQEPVSSYPRLPGLSSGQFSYTSPGLNQFQPLPQYWAG